MPCFWTILPVFVKLTLSFGLVAVSMSARAGVCAKKYSELDRSPRLAMLKPILPVEGKKGFVNETKGSFLYIDSTEAHFRIFFLTTGLFDLYAIERGGEIYFCDTGEALVIVGLGETKTLKSKGEGIEFGRGGPSESFQPGVVPEALKETYGKPLPL